MPENVISPTAELGFMTIAEAARRIEKKELSPVELTTALITRTETLDPQINAYLLLTADRALAQARRTEQEIIAGDYRGPMHGIPFALKDIYSTAGIRTTAHSRICLDTVPSTDATSVTKLYAAGAVLTGKLATHEFAHGGPSSALPWPPAIDQPVSDLPSMAAAAVLLPLAKLCEARTSRKGWPPAVTVSSLRKKSPGAPS